MVHLGSGIGRGEREFETFIGGVSERTEGRECLMEERENRVWG